MVKTNMNARKALTYVIIATLFASYIAIPIVPVAADGTGTIVFDYSHGQDSSAVAFIDEYLDGNLTDMGYTVVWAKGGINASILQGAKGFIAGSIYGTDAGYTSAEVDAIVNWFKTGSKFMWIGYDSDYSGWDYIRKNMTMILDGIGSHVYGEPTSVEDPISNCVAGYRPVATHFANVTGISKILMHGPTCLYGSTTGADGEGAVALETEEIDDVWPILMFNESAQITDADLVEPFAHDDEDVGAFVGATYEANLYYGAVVVSGASPYGDYRPMTADDYYGVTLQGMSFVTQVIDMGMNLEGVTPPSDMTMILLLGGVGVVVIVIIVAIIFMRKK